MMRDEYINEENVETKNSKNRTFRDMLDWAGFLSGPLEPVGMGADLLSGLISIGKGDYERAAWSGTAAVPGLGLVGSAKKFKQLDIFEEAAKKQKVIDTSSAWKEAHQIIKKIRKLTRQGKWDELLDLVKKHD